MTKRLDLVQDWAEGNNSWLEVVHIADRLVTHLNERLTADAVANANRPGRSSAEVQAVLASKATALGFRSEAKGLFKDYSSSALRPDFFRPLGDGSGVIFEVERGKTTINNMDLLDFWKCHICEHANYLMLLVPEALRQNETMAPRREFATVSKRLESFFVEGNYTNVHGLILIGY